MVTDVDSQSPRISGAQSPEPGSFLAEVRVLQDPVPCWRSSGHPVERSSSQVHVAKHPHHRHLSCQLRLKVYNVYKKFAHSSKMKGEGSKVSSHDALASGTVLVVAIVWHTTVAEISDLVQGGVKGQAYYYHHFFGLFLPARRGLGGVQGSGGAAGSSQGVG